MQLKTKDTFAYLQSYYRTIKFIKHKIQAKVKFTYILNCFIEKKRGNLYKTKKLFSCNITFFGPLLIMSQTWFYLASLSESRRQGKEQRYKCSIESSIPGQAHSAYSGPNMSEHVEKDRDPWLDLSRSDTRWPCLHG